MKIFNNESIFEVIVNSNLNVKGDLKSSVAIRMNDDLANHMKEEEINRLKEIADEMAKMFKNPIKEWAIDEVEKILPKEDMKKVVKSSTKELLDKKLSKYFSEITPAIENDSIDNLSNMKMKYQEK